MMKISRRGPSNRSEVAPFEVMEVMREAARLEAAGRRIAHLEVGQPGSPAPEAALQAVREGLGAPLGYTVALGRDDLRAAIADLYRRRHGLEIDPARVIVTTGSSAGFQLVFLACFDSGARLAMADPGYPSYRQIAGALGLEPVGLPVGAAERWAPTPAMLEAAARERPIDGLLNASPANPTGVVTEPDALQAMIEACDAMGARFISDEIYHGLHFGAPAETALRYSDEAIVISSFSKYFSMTGWRIGWLVVPEALIRPIERLAQNFYICPPHVSQIAALAALSEAATPELEAHRARYGENRALLLDMVARLGFTDVAPCDGAFYLYFNLGADPRDSSEWCRALLHEAGVAATPGRDFDPARGSRTARFSFAGSREEVALGAERLLAWAGG